MIKCLWVWTLIVGFAPSNLKQPQRACRTTLGSRRDFTIPSKSLRDAFRVRLNMVYFAFIARNLIKACSTPSRWDTKSLRAWRSLSIISAGALPTNA